MLAFLVKKKKMKFKKLELKIFYTARKFFFNVFLNVSSSGWCYELDKLKTKTK